MNQFFDYIFGFDFPYGLFSAMITGLFGASFFMLIQLQQRISEGSLDDARDVWTYRMIVLRCVVGIGAASILYFFFKSGLLEGSLWPDIEHLGFHDVTNEMSGDGAPLFYVEPNKTVPNHNFSLLIVWSFIAGYSQTLVPNLLLSTENRANSQASN